MYVYLTGSRERANPAHKMYVCPARNVGKHLSLNEIPFDWKDEQGDPKTFTVVFNHGRADVDEKLGEWMVKAGVAQRTNLVRASKSLLSSLAKRAAA